MKTNIGFGLYSILSVCALTIQAHPGPEETKPSLYAALDSKSPSSDGGSPANQVSISVEGDHRIIRANGWPDHAPGQFPNRGNPNTISTQSYSFRMTLDPRTNATPRESRGAWFGVALNGVPFEPGTGEFWNGQRQWNYEALSGFINLGLDDNNAHVQPTGAYHYHGLPAGLIDKLGGDGKKMLLVGYAADGFPIYTSYGRSEATNASSAFRELTSSWQIKAGNRTGGPGGKYDGKFTADYEYVAGSGDLDECNGRFEVTPEFPEGIYCYHITMEFPQLSRQWRGAPDNTFFKRDTGRPPGSPGGFRPPPGEPPRRVMPLRQ